MSKNKVMTFDILTIILNLRNRDKVTWTKRTEYGISNCVEKKSKDKAMFDTHSKK